MKKIFFLVYAFVATPLTIAAMHSTELDLNFKPLTKLNASAEKLFGYNPNIRTSEPLSHKAALTQTALLCLPGVGSRNGEKYTEAFPGSSKYVSVVLNWTKKISEGDLPDNTDALMSTEVGLFVLKHLQSMNYKTVLFGHSYGGGIALKMADMLQYPRYYISSWKKLGLSRTSFSLSWQFPPLDFKTEADAVGITLLSDSVTKIFLDKPAVKDPRSFKHDALFGGQKLERSEEDPLYHISANRIPLRIFLAEKDETLGNDSDEEIKRFTKPGTVETVNEEHKDILTSAQSCISFLEKQ